MLTRAKRRRLKEEGHPEEISLPISPQYGKEHARIKKARAEVEALRQEQRRFDLNMNGKKRDLFDHLAHHKHLLQEGSPFDRLPDELVLKILKMAAWRRSPETATLETVYKVAICQRGYLPYKQIYLISDQKLL